MPAVLSAIAEDYCRRCECSGGRLQPNEEEQEEMKVGKLLRGSARVVLPP